MAAASRVERSERSAVAPSTVPSEARLRLLIASGGDDRIWLDPITRRNRYGAPASPAPEEIWLSSSTAAPVSPRGWTAAGEALEGLAEGGRHTIAGWFDAVRGRLLALYGAPGA